MSTESATRPTKEEDVPPLVRRLFGEHWEELDKHPDIWNRLFGPDSDGEEEDEKQNEAQILEMQKKGAKNLKDHSWIKQRLDEEVHRYLTDEAKLEESHDLNWRRAKVLGFSFFIGVLAQFPYLYPADTELLRSVHIFLIVAFFVVFVYGSCLALLVPWDAILETKPSATGAKDALFVETEMPRYELDFKVRFRSRTSRTVFVERVVHATTLFTPASKLTPEPLHQALDQMLAEIRRKSKEL